jgi:hypothetical protein
MTAARTTLYLALGTAVVCGVCVIAAIGVAFELTQRAVCRLLGRTDHGGELLAGHGEHDALDKEGSFW